MKKLIAEGAAGEICGWFFDGDGQIMNNPINDRVASVPVPPRETCTVVGIAQGRKKSPAILAALRGGLLNGVITDEQSAEYLLTH